MEMWTAGKKESIASLLQKHLTLYIARRYFESPQLLSCNIVLVYISDTDTIAKQFEEVQETFLATKISVHKHLTESKQALMKG